MSKVWKFENPIPWITNDDKEDFFAVKGEYHLRVEQMDTHRWWWRVCYNDTPIQTELNEYATCRSNAIRLAEGVYYGHLAACSLHEQTIQKKFQPLRFIEPDRSFDIHSCINDIMTGVDQLNVIVNLKRTRYHVKKSIDKMLFSKKPLSDVK